MERGSSRSANVLALGQNSCVQDHLGPVWYWFVPNKVEPVQPVQPLAIQSYSIKLVDPSR